MSDEQLRHELQDSFKNRAIIYYLIYDEMRKELGPQRAEEIMGRAIYRRGQQKGKEKYGPFAPDDLGGVAKAFLAGSADAGRMFRPEVTRLDTQGLDLKQHGCPLRETWQEMGLPDEEVATLCRIASRIDNGTFESAGFTIDVGCWRPGQEGCCYLHIRPGRS